MNEPAPQPSPLPPRAGLSRGGFLVLGLLACALAVSNHSYWLDETESVYKASLPTLGEWWTHLRLEGSGNLQLPLYHLFAWVWEKGAGPGEFAMRCGNVPWFFLGAAALALASARGSRGNGIMAVVLLTSPFAWYYLNEARPYALQIAVASLVFASLCRLGEFPEDLDQRRWVLALCCGLLLLSASGLLAMLWAGAYIAAAMLSTPPEKLRPLARRYAREWLVTLVLLGGLGLFYLWTLRIGARATAVGATDFRNLLFIPYELLGFSGLGPGRSAIRSGGGALATFLPWLPWLSVYGVLLLAVMWSAWGEFRGTISRRTAASWAGMFLLVGGFILCVGFAVRFRVLGRHVAPMLPVVLFVLASGLISWLRRGGWTGRLIVAGFVGLSLASCLALRFGERHAKDDYRGAAALGREALGRGLSVWWNADAEGALLYRLPVTRNAGQSQTAFYLANPANGFADNISRPDLVLASKPDIYDRGGALESYLETNGFKRAEPLTGFTAWRRAGP